MLTHPSRFRVPPALAAYGRPVLGLLADGQEERRIPGEYRRGVAVAHAVHEGTRRFVLPDDLGRDRRPPGVHGRGTGRHCHQGEQQRCSHEQLRTDYSPDGHRGGSSTRCEGPNLIQQDKIPSSTGRRIREDAPSTIQLGQLTRHQNERRIRKGGEEEKRHLRNEASNHNKALLTRGTDIDHTGAAVMSYTESPFTVGYDVSPCTPQNTNLLGLVSTSSAPRAPH